MNHVPVLIVGGGPSGLMMACELARHGVHFRIIDKNAERTLTSNASGIQTRTLELFDQIGILDHFIRKGLKCKAVNINASHTLVKILFDQLDSLYHFILMLPQAETEQILNQRLEELNHRVERPVEFLDMSQSGAVFHIEFKNQTGNTESMTCDWLIACDGAHSAVRDDFGVHFSGEDINEQFMVADAKMDAFLRSDEVHVFTKAGKALAVFPVDASSYRLAANLHLNYPRQFFTEKEVKEIVIERGQGEFSVQSVSWISPFWIHSKMLDKFRFGHLFFVGDAAHIHSPMGGQGMNTGIQDAYNLAWKLALVVNKQADERILDSYQAERFPIVKGIVNETEFATKILISDSKFIAFIRTLVLKFIRNKRFILNKISMRITQLSLSYKNSPIVRDTMHSNKSVRAGMRAPDVQMTPPKRLYDHFRNTQHNILLFAGTAATRETIEHLMDVQEWISQHYSEIANSYLVIDDSTHINHHVIHDVDNAIHKRYGVDEVAVYIIRPDQYIGACLMGADHNAIEAYFDGLFIN